MSLLLVCASAQAQQYRVDSIVVEGIKKTKALVVTRQMTFTTGDTLDRDDFEEVLKINRSNIYNLGLFTSVELVPELGLNSLTMHVQVQERWYVWPTPELNVLERTFGEWWQDKDLDRLVYGLGVDWSNFTGWNDRLSVYAQGGYSQVLAASYYRPFLFPKAQIDGSFALRFSSDKEIGYSTEQGFLQLLRLQNSRMRQTYLGRATFSKRLSARKQIQFSVGYNHYNINDSINFVNTDYLPGIGSVAHYPSIGIAYVNDQRDIRSFPLEGHKVSGSLRQIGLPGIGTSRFAKLSLSFSHHIPIGRRWNFAYGGQQFVLLGKRTPYFEKYFIGFGSFLRGYEPYVIDGSFINLTKAEWKFGIIPYKMAHLKWLPFPRFRDFPMGLYLSTYADAGYVTDWTFNNQDNTLKNKMLLGYGVGLNFVTIYDFMMRIEYSFNNLGGRGLYLSSIVSIQ